MRVELEQSTRVLLRSRSRSRVLDARGRLSRHTGPIRARAPKRKRRKEKTSERPLHLHILHSRHAVLHKKSQGCRKARRNEGECKLSRILCRHHSLIEMHSLHAGKGKVVEEEHFEGGSTAQEGGSQERGSQEEGGVLERRL